MKIFFIAIFIMRFTGVVSLENKYYSVTYTNVTWAEANEKCQKENGHLATIHNEQEQIALAEEIKRTGGTNQFWIGLSRYCPNITSLQWIDGQNSSYRNWYDQNSENNLDHCTVIQSEDGRWTNRTCNSMAFFVCENYYSNTFALETPCEPNWCYMNNSCYLVGYNHQTERDQAQKMCENDGANLASIHSQEENDFIFQLASLPRVNSLIFYTSVYYPSPIWLGLYQIGTESNDNVTLNCDYYWQDQSAFDFDHWANFPPHHYNLNERWCTEMCGTDAEQHCFGSEPGHWNQLPCSYFIYPRNYVCRKTANTYEPTSTSLTTIVDSSSSTIATSKTVITTTKIATSEITTTTVATSEITTTTSATAEPTTSSSQSLVSTTILTLTLSAVGLNNGQIVGIVIGILALVSVTTAAIVFTFRRFRILNSNPFSRLSMSQLELTIED